MDRLMVVLNCLMNDQAVYTAGNLTEEPLALKGFMLPGLAH